MLSCSGDGRERAETEGHEDRLAPSVPVEELARVGEYQHQIVNDDKDRATHELAALVRGRFPELPG